ncbi:permease prefix domain 1-containing protein [Paenibacillus riograndensis]|uniref:Putative membrane protein n=1 Tax=Paenibacillus riograndensis SBR5 TaxID=1073571 RepID=A0A0E3WH91_9BACL|nr:permease prefix domain 1-containing protein [Paenibacillus riograndensis]CQR54878.1 putative membrane protein [Paenibacillus riograndensis SBR5]
MTDYKLNGKSAGRIAAYVENLCRHMKEPSEQVNDFREEMTANLTSSVLEQMHQGLPEEEAVTEALARFGELGEVKKELVRIYNIKRTFAGIVLKGALSLLLLSAVVLGLIIGVWNEWAVSKYPKEAYAMVQGEANVRGTEPLSEPLQQKLQNWVDRTWGVKGVSVEPTYGSVDYRGVDHRVNLFMYAENPLAEGMLRFVNAFEDAPPPEQEGFLVKTNAFSEVGYNPADFDLDQTQYPFVVHVAMTYFNYTFFYSLGLFLLGGYALLFTVWASMNAYYERRGNVAWVLLFLLTNVLGYGLYVVSRRWDHPGLQVN